MPFCPSAAEWGSVGEVVSGLGTLTAVVATIVLWRVDRYREHKSTRMRATILAYKTKPEISALMARVRQSASMLRSLALGQSVYDIEEVDAMLRIHGNVPDPEAVVMLSPTLAMQFAELSASLHVFNRYLDHAKQYGVPNKTMEAYGLKHPLLDTDRVVPIIENASSAVERAYDALLIIAPDAREP